MHSFRFTFKTFLRFFPALPLGQFYEILNALRALTDRNRKSGTKKKNCDKNSGYCMLPSGDFLKVNKKKLQCLWRGFLIDENDLNEQEDSPKKIADQPAPIIKSDRPNCDECGSEFHDSFLFRSFLYPVCDSCKDNEDKHQLITRTDARQEYLLKDCDIDLREPPLKFVLRKNPHNSRWGDMKLYLRLQVEKRALEVWGSEEKLEEERQIRDDKREKSKVKKFNKQIKALRMSVRSSMYRMKETENHQHAYGPESYDEDSDTYQRTCKSCGFVESFEKM
nr:EOG090X0KP6 [Eulimnadia texana]